MKKLLGILVLSLIICSQSFAGDSHKKMQIIFDDYRIYSHRPGGVKIRRLSDNKQLIILTGKFKTKYYNNGEDIFKLKLNEENQKISLEFNGVKILYWRGRYLKKHRAYFFQMFALDEKPLHYYIVSKNGRQVSLDISKFNRKVDLALVKAKKELTLKFNLTPEQIELILKRKNQKINSTLNKLIQEKEDEEIQSSSEDTMMVSVDEKITKELEATIGESLADEYYAAIQEASSEILDGALSSELASAIDEEIAKAITEGISSAAAEAGIEAGLDILAAGGTEAEALAACSAAAGTSC